MSRGLLLQPYSILLIAAALIALLLATRAWVGTRKALARSFALFSTAIFVWCLFKLLEGELVGLDARFEAHRLEYLGICLIPGSLFLFARAFAARPARGVAIALILLPGFLLIAVVATNGLHHAFWPAERLGPGGRNPPVGWAFWIFLVYAYSCLAAAMATLARTAAIARGLYGRLLKLVLALSLPPIVANLFYVFVMRGSTGLDPTPVVFSICGLGVNLILDQFDVFDTVPYAKGVVLESIDTPLLVADAEGYIVGANDEARRFFSSREALEGVPISKVAPVLGGAMADREARPFSHDGVDYLVTCYVVRKGPKSWRGRLFLFRDIAALAKANRDLAEARERAEAANASKSAYVATVSHELRNPLNAIIGLSDLDLRDSLPDNVRADLETIRSSSRQLLGIVNDLLDISKMEAGKLELESVDFDMREQAMSVIRAFRPAVAMKGVVLDVQIEDDAPRVVKGDPLRFGQVLMNLLGNAVKFTSKGSIVVRIAGASPRLDDGDPRSERALVEVRDTGIGIPESGMAGLFKEFAQADKSMSRRYGGTGLGLSICKRLVGLMGGEIEVESREGSGSVFSFTARFEPGEIEGIVSRAVEGEGEPPARVLRVLVADDDPVNATIARRYVERLGHETTIAGTGTEALTLLREGRFDLALIDLHFPDVDGIEVVRSFSSEGAGAGARSVFLVAMTANAGPEAVALCRAAGMDDFLSKPLNPDELRHLLTRVCESEPVAKDAPRDAETDPVVAARSREAALIDEAALLEQLDGDAEFMRELLGIFVEEAPTRAAAIDAAKEAEDLAALRSIVHKLRGSALTLHAGPLSAAAGAIESAIPDPLPSSGFDGFEFRVDAIMALLGRTADTARTILERGGDKVIG